MDCSHEKFHANTFRSGRLRLKSSSLHMFLARKYLHRWLR